VSLTSLCGLTATVAYGASISVSHNLAGNASARGPGDPSESRPFSDAKSRTIPLDPGDHFSKTEIIGNVGDFVVRTASEGSGLVQSRAQAEIARVSVQLSGTVSGENSAWTHPTNRTAGSASLSNCFVEAGWEDSLFLSTDQFPPGTPIAAKGTLRVSGEVEAFVHSSALADQFEGSSIVQADIYATGFVVSSPYPQGYYALARDDELHLNTRWEPFFNEIPIALLTFNKQTTTRGIRLRLLASALATSNFAQGGAMTSFFEGDLSHTLEWGGITSVTHADTDEEIENWTLTSESGFDYSKPYVPEPEAGAAAAAALGCLYAILWLRSGRNADHRFPTSNVGT
jgi:hypothetical protein